MRHPLNTKILRQNLPSSSQPTSIIPISSSKSDFKQSHQPVCGRQWPDFLNHNLQISKYHYKTSCAPALPKSLPPTMSAIPNTILRVSSSAVQAAARSTSKPFTRVGVVVSAGKMPKMIKVRVPSPVWNSKLRKVSFWGRFQVCSRAGPRADQNLSFLIVFPPYKRPPYARRKLCL
ncbi:hypothetical protein TWF706_008389 [Orbilia oligospora]|nr:hypothetical protein TWF706_008389 [Orbilia oligospora]